MNVHAPQQRRAVTAAMTEGLSFQPPRISINNGMFTLIDRAGNELQCNLVDPQLGRYLDVVIAGANANKSKIFYADDWTPNSTEPPICWSDNGVAPSTGAQSPQWATCQGCPQNVIGSDQSKRTGRNIKACQDRKKLACFVVGMPGGELYQFQVTPGALKNLGAYGKWVSGQPSRSGQGPADVSEVVTRLYFVQDAVGVIGFAAVAPIDDVQDLAIENAWASGRIPEIIGSNDTPIQGLLAAPQPQQQLVAPVQHQQTQQQLQPPQQGQWAPVAAQPARAPAPQAPPPKPELVFDQASNSWVPMPAAAPPSPPAPPPKPELEWSAVANAWIPVNAAGTPTYGQTIPAQPEGRYPAPAPGSDPYGVPAFLQQAPAGHPTAPQGGSHASPVAQAPQAQIATSPSNGQQPGFSAPVQQPGGRGKGRGGPRVGAGRPPAAGAVAHAQPAPQPQGGAPGAAFGAPPGNAPAQQHAPFQQPGATPPPPPGQQFGMQPAAPPPPDMSGALDRAFGTPVPR